MLFARLLIRLAKGIDMSFSPNDLCVFVATYNRADLLQTQLESLMSQTVRPDVITVLDNGGSPATRDLVESLSGRGVKYVDTTAYGRLGNMLTAQKLSSGRYVAIFHDDDAVERHYFESVLAVLNGCADEDIRLVTTMYIPQQVGRFSFPTETPHINGLIMDRAQYADFVLNAYSGFPFAFYAIEQFRKLDAEKMWKDCGKWYDIPMQLEVVGDGRAAFLYYPFGVYGHHPKQDSADPSNLPDVRAWANLESYYVRALGDDLYAWPGWTNVVFNRRRLLTGYKRRGKKTISKKEYMEYARFVGAVNRHPVLTFLLSRRLVQKAYTAMRVRTFAFSVRPLTEGRFA